MKLFRNIAKAVLAVSMLSVMVACEEEAVYTPAQNLTNAQVYFSNTTAKDVKLTVAPAEKGITVTPATTLDKALYETALTMTVNTDGKKIKAEQDGKSLEVTYRDNNAYVTFCPFGGPVTIR